MCYHLSSVFKVACNYDSFFTIMKIIGTKTVKQNNHENKKVVVE